jgi:BRCT domain type II-containing protein
MGHNILAIIGKSPVNEEKVKEYKLAAIYEGGFAIIILHFDSILG